MVIPVVLTMWFLFIRSPELDAVEVHGGDRNLTVFYSEEACIEFAKQVGAEVHQRFPDHPFQLKCAQEPRLERFVEDNRV